MAANLEELLDHVESASSYGNSTREGIALAASQHITLYSAVLGFVIRSSTTRNPFELYYPFRQIAQRFFRDERIYLVLSSEWDYVPFTYPMTLNELPNFILIGMPAPEADNVLAFPLAGHELGHSVWKKQDLRAAFSSKVLEKTRLRFEREPNLLKSIYKSLPAERFEDDLFASQLKEDTISDIIYYCLRQMEELFCDLIALHVFGSAYVCAFRYLLAPTDSGERSLEYPELSERAKAIEEYAISKTITSAELSRWFASEGEPSQPVENATVKIVDAVRREMFPELSSAVEEIVFEAGLTHPGPSQVQDVKERFMMGMPLEGEYTIGELICGAWEYCFETFNKPITRERRVELDASNLVLKSAEAIEYKARITIAG